VEILGAVAKYRRRIDLFDDLLHVVQLGFWLFVLATMALSFTPWPLVLGPRQTLVLYLVLPGILGFATVLAPLWAWRWRCPGIVQILVQPTDLRMARGGSNKAAERWQADLLCREDLAVLKARDYMWLRVAARALARPTLLSRASEACAFVVFTALYPFIFLHVHLGNSINGRGGLIDAATPEVAYGLLAAMGFCLWVACGGWGALLSCSMGWGGSSAAESVYECAERLTADPPQAPAVSAAQRILALTAFMLGLLAFPFVVVGSLPASGNHKGIQLACLAIIVGIGVPAAYFHRSLRRLGRYREVRSSRELLPKAEALWRYRFEVKRHLSPGDPVLDTMRRYSTKAGWRLLTWGSGRSKKGD